MDAVKGILAPLVALLLAAGIDYTRLAAELKPIFIEQARRELQRSDRKVTDSAISLLSGIHRKDVHKWRETGLDEVISQEISISTQIYTRWLHDANYLNSRKKPKPLPRFGPAPSFESLARSVTQDVHPYTVLTELLRLGLVSVENRGGKEMVIPKRAELVPAPDTLEILQLFGHNVSDHAAAAVDNILGQPARLEQSVFATGITAESAELLSQLARKLWTKARADMIAQAIQCHERDKGKTDATRRMRFGAYYWDDEIVEDHEKSTNGGKNDETD